MKLILLIVLLFFVAIAVSPFMINEKGYILIAMGDLTIESTVVTATIMLILSFVLLLITLKVFRGGLKLSFGTWHKIAFASRRRALRDLNKGIAAYVLQDYKQAEHLLAKCAQPSQFEHIAYLLAADAADKQALRPNTHHYLALLDKNARSAETGGLEAILIKIKLFIGQKELAKARAIIDQHHKQVGHDARLLSLEIELSLAEKRFDYVIKQLNFARKEKSLSVDTVSRWESQTFYGAFNEKITRGDQQSLTDFWQQLPRKIKRSHPVLLAYCQVLAQHNICDPLTKILLPSIKNGSDIAFLKQLRTLPITQATPLLSAAQQHLHRDPHSAIWLAMVAHFAIFDNQPALAEKAFNSLLHIEGEQYDVVDLEVFARLLEQQNDFAKANQILRKLQQLSEKSSI